ncbi:UDP-2,4-diacetamido-2,4,6-trideoxy-beta-L-altropyranose hydrolase [Sulfuricystis multivorans]|uniref:UDP-2,4-diacetamido-2,4, 6-trideoxy-beta-L-altropyranose hydrolase n=1 Tax=Sulfuricystis multivorans TaxID=2211108 RepID=UPI000F82A3FC|nr:UDP-2,4-diacetamido-2,4,6-trideoxy-beta-L-altropyranose hydrolase [Sulfuricystis multivorans]
MKSSLPSRRRSTHEDRHRYKEEREPVKVLFRADASFEIGTGHVMRCLTLAEALRERGARCRFVCRAHPGNLIDTIRQKGFEVHALPYCADWRPAKTQPAHAAWLGADWAVDAEETKLGAGGNESVPPGADSLRRVGAGGTAPDWLIVDHYGIDARWERAMRPYVRQIFVIDDLADRAHECDALLDQNLGRQDSDYADLIPPQARIFIGPRHALVRKEFAQWREYSLKRREHPQLKRLLVSLGGVDKDNVTARVLGVLSTCTLPPDLEITVVLGKNAPWIDAVKAQAERMPRPTKVLVDVENMAELLAQSDLAIGAAGSSAWERCCLGVPTLQMVLAQNQETAHAALVAAGAALPWPLYSTSERESQGFESLLPWEDVLKNISQAASQVCDGKGVFRAISEVFGVFDENQFAV